MTGHDHGMGMGHLIDLRPTLFEFGVCDTFVTYTANQARALEKGFRPDLMIHQRVPNIVAAPSWRHSIASAKDARQDGSKSQQNRSASSIRTIMYPSMFHVGEQGHFVPPVPDIAQVDWQARLISHVCRWGYEFLLKPHPSTAVQEPRFATELGARTITERFETVMDAADAFLFDSPSSTTFAKALSTDKPVIFIDHGRVVFTPEARAMLEKRCAIVIAWFDQDNRLQTDWDELRDAIERSRYLDDTSFFDYYFESWV